MGPLTLQFILLDFITYFTCILYPNIVEPALTSHCSALENMPVKGCGLLFTIQSTTAFIPIIICQYSFTRGFSLGSLI